MTDNLIKKVAEVIDVLNSMEVQERAAVAFDIMVQHQILEHSMAVLRDQTAYCYGMDQHYEYEKIDINGSTDYSVMLIGSCYAAHDERLTDEMMTTWDILLDPKEFKKWHEDNRLALETIRQELHEQKTQKVKNKKARERHKTRHDEQKELMRLLKKHGIPPEYYADRQNALDELSALGQEIDAGYIDNGQHVSSTWTYRGPLDKT